MKKVTITILILFLGLAYSFSQDVIVKKDGTKMEVIIKEVGEKNIKYVEPKDPNGIVFSIDKALVREVKFSYGKKMEVKNPETNETYYADDKIQNFTLNFTAIGANTLALGYERALKPGHSVFAEAKIYGVGIKTIDEVSRNGFGLDLGYRLKMKSLFDKNEYRPKHLLHGSYFSPVLGFSAGSYKYIAYDYYDVTTDSYINNEQEDTHSIVHFGLQFGKEWILQNTLSVDASVGFHYYGGSFDQNEKGFNPLRLGNMIGDENKLFAFGLRIGLLAGKKGLSKKK